MRTPNPIIVTGPDGLPVAGVSVYTRDANTGAEVIVYADRTGRKRAANPAVTDDRGRVTQYLERGAYASEVRGRGIQDYVEEWDAAPGGAPLTDDQFPDGVVTGRMLADDAVDERVLAASTLAGLAVIPVGGEIRYAGATLPDGFAVSDGGLIDRDEHPAFFAAVVHAHNHGIDPGDNKVRKPATGPGWIVRIT